LPSFFQQNLTTILENPIGLTIAPDKKRIVRWAFRTSYIQLPWLRNQL